MASPESQIVSQSFIKTSSALSAGLAAALVHHPFDRYLTVKMGGGDTSFFTRRMFDGLSMTILSKVISKCAFLLAFDQLPKVTQSMLLRANVQNKFIQDITGALAVGLTTSLLTLPPALAKKQYMVAKHNEKMSGTISTQLSSPGKFAWNTLMSSGLPTFFRGASICIPTTSAYIYSLQLAREKFKNYSDKHNLKNRINNQLAYHSLLSILPAMVTSIILILPFYLKTQKQISPIDAKPPKTSKLLMNLWNTGSTHKTRIAGISNSLMPCTFIVRKGLPIGFGIAMYEATQEILEKAAFKPKSPV